MEVQADKSQMEYGWSASKLLMELEKLLGPMAEVELVVKKDKGGSSIMSPARVRWHNVLIALASIGLASLAFIFAGTKYAYLVPLFWILSWATPTLFIFFIPVFGSAKYRCVYGHLSDAEFLRCAYFAHRLCERAAGSSDEEAKRLIKKAVRYIRLPFSLFWQTSCSVPGNLKIAQRQSKARGKSDRSGNLLFAYMVGAVTKPQIPTATLWRKTGDFLELAQFQTALKNQAEEVSRAWLLAAFTAFSLCSKNTIEGYGPAMDKICKSLEVVVDSAYRVVLPLESKEPLGKEFIYAAFVCTSLVALIPVCYAFSWERFVAPVIAVCGVCATIILHSISLRNNRLMRQQGQQRPSEEGGEEG
ncbi:MAG: hypothetical protein ABFD92_05250 [Planctomycetaceae bacterium]|nr:hypothetical protein [Planctomycetaceae bacterium]